MRTLDNIKNDINRINDALKSAKATQQFSLKQELKKLQDELAGMNKQSITVKKMDPTKGNAIAGILNAAAAAGAGPQTAGSVKPVYKDREPEKKLVSEEQLEALNKLINDNTGYDGLISALNTMKDLSADVKARVSAALNIFKDQKKPYMVAKMVLPQQLPSILSVGSSLAPASEPKPILKTSEPTKPGLGVGQFNITEHLARLKKTKATNVNEQVVNKLAAGNNTSAPAKLNVPNKQNVTNKQKPQTNAPAQIKSPLNTVKPQIKTPSTEKLQTKSPAPAQTVAKPILNVAPTNNNAATPAPASKPKRRSYVRTKAKEIASGFVSFMTGTKRKKNATPTQTLTTYNGNTASPKDDGNKNKQKPGKT